MENDNNLLDCPNCIDGIEYSHDIFGDYESECSWCKGTGTLNKTQSDNLRKLRKLYWKQKTT